MEQQALRTGASYILKRNTMKKVISVRFKENGKSYYFDPAGAEIRTGDYVIVETARGIECGEVVQGVREITDAAVPKALKPITRMADSVDIRRSSCSRPARRSGAARCGCGRCRPDP